MVGILDFLGFWQAVLVVLGMGGGCGFGRVMFEVECYVNLA